MSTVMLKHLEHFSVIESGYPVLGGHIMKKIAEKFGSEKMIQEWANSENNCFPHITLDTVESLKRLFRKKKGNNLFFEICQMPAHLITKLDEETDDTTNCWINAVSTDEESHLLSKRKKFRNLKKNLMEKLKCYKEKTKSLRKQLVEANTKYHQHEERLKKLRKRRRNDRRDVFFMKRRLCYDCIFCGVAASAIPNLVVSLLESMKLRNNLNMSKRSIYRMVGELGFFSDFLTADSVLKVKNATLLFNSMTQDELHISCISITTAISFHLVSVKPVPTGNASDYKLHVCNSITKLARAYSSVTCNSFDGCLQDLISRINTCLTDHSPENYKTVSLLNEEWGKNLVEKKCNIDPLEAVSKEVKKAFSNFESVSIKKILPGEDCLAWKIMSGLNSLKTSDAKGDDTMAFQKFLQTKTLNVSINPRFRGNQLHIIFHLGTLFHIYYDDFVAFLQGLSNLTETCINLQLALEEDIAASEFQTLAVISKLFYWPWMNTFYSCSMTQLAKNYMDITKSVIVKLEQQIQKPDNILSAQTDFLGNSLIYDEELQKVMRYPVNPQLFYPMITICMERILTILKRQCSQTFFSVAGGPDEFLSASARVHTTSVESIMTEFCEQKRFSPNAKLNYISNLIKAKRNYIREFIHDLDTDRLKFFLDLAIPYSREENEGETCKNEESQFDISNI